MPKVLSIVITYNPNIESLKTLLVSILNIKKTNNTKHDLLLVDNNSINNRDITSFCSNKNIMFNLLTSNTGIAYAQNIGIKYAIENSYDYIMLSDQDSIFPADYFLQMLPYVKQDIAAIGPSFINTNSNIKSGYIKKIRIRGFKQPKSGVLNVRHIIASGKVISLSNIKKIGLMDENLFIDYVDLEWCWRAEKNKLKILFNANTSIKHTLGDSSAKILKKEYQIRNSIRYYYLVRNGIYLAIYNPQKTLSIYERIIIFCKSLIYTVVYSLHRPRIKNSSACFQGLIDGIKKKLGKNPSL